jgi:HAD superfamily hydrolase (TIGR01484 family)
VSERQLGFRPRLLALDVDGTLVDSDNTMSPAVREAVRAMRDSGVDTIITTGRAIPGVMDTANKLGLDDGHAIASNGAIVFEYDPVKVLHSVTFDASEAVRRVLKHVPEALVAVEEIGVGYRVSRPFPDGEISGRIIVEDVDALISDPVTRVVIRAPERSAEDFGALVEELGLADTNYYIGYTAWLDLAPEGVSKASGLEYICDRLGIAQSEVLAVGDGNNDIEMLRWAGRGVAMGHAPDTLKAAADAVTGDITEDGLVQELTRYL